MSKNELVQTLTGPVDANRIVSYSIHPLSLVESVVMVRIRVLVEALGVTEQRILLKLFEDTAEAKSYMKRVLGE